MQYKMTQGELCDAVQRYLNDVVLKCHVRITSVKPINYPTPYKKSDVALEIECADDQEHVEDTDATLPSGAEAQ